MVTKKYKTTLEGERIHIRPLRLSDADDIYNYAKDKQIGRWMMTVPYPYPKEEAVKFIRRLQRQTRLQKGFGFAIVDNQTNRVIGTIGLGRYDAKHKCAELGYTLSPKLWGRGLTTEAARLTLDFGFKQLKLHRIYAMTFGANTSSRRILEKCGFQQEGIMRQAVIRFNRRHDFINYGILKSEYQALSPKPMTKKKSSPKKRK